ncbi:MAG TPA: hypothetical protein VGD79_01535 [Thermoanaerobaculia bacterium]|jgi:hypothetical protein
MKVTTKNATLTLVTPGTKYNQMKTKSFDATLPADYTSFCAVAGHLLAYASASGRLDVYANPAKGTLGAPVHSQTIGTGFSVLAAFALGTAAGTTNVQMVLAYDASTGAMQFFTISGNALHAQNTAKGPKTCTTMLPFLTWNGSYVLGYDAATGSVGTYQLTASGGSNVSVKQVWNPPKKWAAGWTRFGPFQFGHENFFIKTNAIHHNTYVDHLLDDASLGSHPDHPDVPLDPNLTAVATFVLGGDPCFATYQAKNGKTTFNRFTGALLWVEGATDAAVKKGTAAVALSTPEPMLLFY